MFATHAISLFALNVAIASLLCTSLALIISACFGSLPKRYATLVVGLIACSLSPLVVGLGTAYSLGRLPAVLTLTSAADPVESIPSEPIDELISSSRSFSPQMSEQLIEAPLVTNDPVTAIPHGEIAAAVVPPVPSKISAKESSLSSAISASLLCTWLFGSLMMLGAQSRKLVLCRRFLAACQPVTDSSVQGLFAAVAQRLGMRNSIPLLESDVLPTPVVIAIGRPAVILPADIGFSLTANQLDSVLTHELSHIARKDHWAAAIQALTRILYWWNPLVHLASRRASELREMICDDIATSSHIAPKEYAHTIIQMAERTAATRELVGSLGISLSPISELERRLRRIIAQKSQAVDLRISKRFLIGLSTFSVAMVTGLLFAQVPQGAEKPLAATQANSEADSVPAPARPQREVTLRGQVTYPDGTPASNMSLHVMGVSYERNTYEDSTTTDLDGRYEFSVPSNQICALYIQDSVWTESELTGFAVTNQDTIQRDLRLRHVTHLHGKILDTVNNEGVSDQPFVLTRRGIDWQAIAKDAFPNPGTMPLWTYPIQSISATTDKDGNYEFWLGDGDYQLTTKCDGGFQEAKVRGEAEVLVDTPVQLMPRVELVAQVIDNTTGLAVSGAKINSLPVNFDSSPSRRDDRFPASSRRWSMLSDQNGRFKVKRFAETQFLQVTTADNSLRALVKLLPYETTKEIRLGHAGSLHGRLMNEDGSAPAAHKRLTCGIRITDEETKMMTYRFGSDVETDEDGNFKFANLYPFGEYEINFMDSDWRVLQISKIVALPARDLDLADVRLPSSKQYVPPTLDQRIDMNFNAPGNTTQQFDRASKIVEVANQNLLVLFCYQSDPRARSLLATKISSAFEPYRADFRVLSIDVGGSRLEAAQSIAKKFDVDLSGGREAFHVLLLSRAGHLITNLDAPQLCDGDMFAQARLFAVLDQHRIEPRNAKAVFEEALLRATREKKKVLVQQTATWSLPSHSLTSLLQDFPQWERDYVWVQIDDRWTGAHELLDGLKKGGTVTAPWYAVLDSSGNILATSDSPDLNENVGDPLFRQSFRPLIKMFRLTRVHMSDVDIEKLDFAALSYRLTFEL